MKAPMVAKLNDERWTAPLPNNNPALLCWLSPALTPSKSSLRLVKRSAPHRHRPPPERRRATVRLGLLDTGAWPGLSPGLACSTRGLGTRLGLLGLNLRKWSQPHTNLIVSGLGHQISSLLGICLGHKIPSLLAPQVFHHSLSSPLLARAPFFPPLLIFDTPRLPPGATWFATPKSRSSSRRCHCRRSSNHH